MLGVRIAAPIDKYPAELLPGGSVQIPSSVRRATIEFSCLSLHSVTEYQRMLRIQPLIPVIAQSSGGSLPAQQSKSIG